MDVEAHERVHQNERLRAPRAQRAGGTGTRGAGVGLRRDDGHVGGLDLRVPLRRAEIELQPQNCNAPANGRQRAGICTRSAQGVPNERREPAHGDALAEEGMAVRGRKEDGPDHGRRADLLRTVRNDARTRHGLQRAVRAGNLRWRLLRHSSEQADPPARSSDGRMGGAGAPPQGREHGPGCRATAGPGDAPRREDTD